MTLVRFRRSIPKINSWLLAALFFSIPLHVAAAYNISVLMLLLWLVEGSFKEKWIRLRSNPMFWIFQAYFWVFVLSLLWTENLDDGLRIVRRSAFILLSPLYLTVANKKDTKRYFMAFLASISICVVFAYYNWLRMHYLPQLPPGIMVVNKSIGDTAPIIDRLLYAPILAFAAYLSAHKAIFSQEKMIKRAVYFILFVAIVGNLIFSGGRAGQLAFAVLMALLAIQRFARRPVLGVFFGIIVVGCIFTAAYSGNSYFRERTDLAIYEVTHFKKMAGTPQMNSSSVGLRFTFWSNSFLLFMENPVIGVGVGDFAKSYAEINQHLTPAVSPTVNPHNQFLFVLVTTGMLGGVIMFFLYMPPGFWNRKSTDLETIKEALPAFFLTISMFESYIYRSNTCLMLVMFTSVLYYDEKMKILSLRKR